jgi:16S rRNA processing protein RimM
MIVLGRITAPYGVKGWLRLHPFGDDPGSWSNIQHWWLGADEASFGDWRAFRLQTMRLQGKSWLVKLTGVDGRDAAEALVGQYVGAPRAALPQTAADEYYWDDLVGLQVVNQEEHPLGRVVEMIESGAHAVMVVMAGDGEKAQRRLLPFVGAVVKTVDVAAGRMTVDWQADW